MGDEADVYVDGEPVGECPITVKVTPGKHEILVKREFPDGSYFNYSKTTTVSSSVDVKKLPVYLVRYKGDKYYFRKTAKSGNEKDFEYYIKNYPNGKYIDKVKNELERIYFVKCNSIKRCNEYLSRYPDGKYRNKAETKIDRFFYMRCESSNCYREYLDQFPNGNFTAEALNKIKNLKYIYVVFIKDPKIPIYCDNKVVAIVDGKKGIEIVYEPDWQNVKVKAPDGRYCYAKTASIIYAPFHLCRGDCYKKYIFSSTVKGRDDISVNYFDKPQGQKIMGSVRSGEQLEVIKEENDWFQIQTYAGKIGWIWNRFTASREAIDNWCVEGGCINGFGKFRSPVGCYYEGNFKHGLKHGKGTFIWPNGTKYIGSYYFGKMDGEGKMYYFDGKAEVVKYDKGKLKEKTDLQ